MSPSPSDPFLDAVQETERFISSRWAETIRVSTEDRGELIGLPYPYTVPCRKDTFQELYYWDTYFTNLGLLRSGRADLAESNIRNFLWEIERFGFVPNGNRTYFLSHSQPPYLCAMLRSHREATGSDALLREALPQLEKEYAFWTTERATASGLSRHWHHGDAFRLKEFSPVALRRVPIGETSETARMEHAAQCIAECESGWDFTPRFGGRCGDFCPVDLNSNLYLYECTLAEMATGRKRKDWQKKALQRRDLMRELCWDEARGVYFDFNHVRNERSRQTTVATFHPLWSGMADEGQANLIVQNALPLLEFPFGIVPCRLPDDERTWQWAAPNLWPCLQNIVSRSLARYGFVDDAVRVAAKYAAAIAWNFQETGDLWEKYNAESGSLRTANEKGYTVSAAGAPPALLGWTAGAFLDAVHFLSGMGNLEEGRPFFEALEESTSRMSTP